MGRIIQPDQQIKNYLIIRCAKIFTMRFYRELCSVEIENDARHATEFIGTLETMKLWLRETTIINDPNGIISYETQP